MRYASLMERHSHFINCILQEKGYGLRCPTIIIILLLHYLRIWIIHLCCFWNDVLVGQHFEFGFGRACRSADDVSTSSKSCSIHSGNPSIASIGVFSIISSQSPLKYWTADRSALVAQTDCWYHSLCAT